MTESSTSDSSKSTTTTRRSKASLSPDEAATTGAQPEAVAAPPPAEAEPSPRELLPGFVANRRGASETFKAIEAVRFAKKLPSLSLVDYRFLIKRPGGIPFSVPIEVIYKAESPEEVNLGIFRIRF